MLKIIEFYFVCVVYGVGNGFKAYKAYIKVNIFIREVLVGKTTSDIIEAVCHQIQLIFVRKIQLKYDTNVRALKLYSHKFQYSSYNTGFPS